MQPLNLYPLKTNLQKGVATGLAGAGLGGYLITLDSDFEWFVIGLFGVLFGGYLAISSAIRLARPMPVFEADATGFSVKGSAKKPWSSFRGVDVHQVKSGLFTVGHTVRIKVGKTMLGRAKQIKWTEMSASASEMSREIERYADAAKIAASDAHIEAVVGSSLDAIEPARRPVRAVDAAPNPAPATFEPRSFAQRLQDTNGPVQSTPRLSERLFGRRKVI